MRLSTAVGLAMLAGVVLAGVGEWILFAAFHPQRRGTSVDVTKLALTVVGGVGGVVALVIAYRVSAISSRADSWKGSAPRPSSSA